MKRASPAPSGPVRSTRDRLIDAAFTVVAREGLEAASVKSIAAEAGIAPGLVHYHFASKDALLEAALRQAMDDYLAAGEARRRETAAADQLERLLAEALSTVEEKPDLFRVRLAFAARSLSDPGLAARVAAMNREAAADTALTLAAARSGEAPTPDEQDMARVLKALFEGIMLARLIDPTFPVPAAASLVEAGLRAELERLQSR